MEKHLHSIKEYLMILIGGVLYGLSTILFIFPHAVLLGGTSGVAVILASFIPLTPATFSVIINTLLLILALIILGKGMAIKTLIGSLITTASIALFEIIFKNTGVLIDSPLISAIIGAIIIAIASALMFYVDSSSGGTDIIALIIKKFSNIQIGKALLLSDVIIVVVGGILAGWKVAIYSVIGFLIKTLGIDFIIKIITRFYKTK